MFSKPTTFVIGAGASCEFGLPDGPALVTKIAAALDLRYDIGERRYILGDPQIAETFRNNSDDNAWQQAGWRIRDGLPDFGDSIDSYLDNHRDDAEMQRVGRVAIVKRILDAEKASKLAIDRQRSPNPGLKGAELADTWISALFRSLQRNCDKKSVGNFFNNCNMIVFNYDRCIEQYFENAIHQSYHIPLDDAGRIVAAAPIIHAYGTVGALPGHSNNRHESVSFGNTRVDLLEVSNRIRTFTDQMSDKATANAIEKYMHDCEVLVFLGFAFHPQNLDLLQVHTRRHNPLVVGTAYGVSQYNRLRYAKDLATRYSPGGDEPILADLKCGQFMREYSGAFDR